MTTFSTGLDRRTLLLGSVGIFALTACDAPNTDSQSSGKGTASGEISLLTATIPETLNPIAGFGNTGMGKINEA